MDVQQQYAELMRSEKQPAENEGTGMQPSFKNIFHLIDENMGVFANVVGLGMMLYERLFGPYCMVEPNVRDLEPKAPETPTGIYFQIQQQLIHLNKEAIKAQEILENLNQRL